MTETADVIVIGGGIHGCSTALHLAMRGIRVTLLEKDYPGRHSSGVNAGGVRQLARHLAEVPISVFSMSLWEHIVDLVDDDCGFVSHGQVLIAENANELDEFRDRVDDLRLRGFTHEELIGRDELKRLCLLSPIIALAESYRAATAQPIHFARLTRFAARRSR